VTLSKRLTRLLRWGIAIGLVAALFRLARPTDLVALLRTVALLDIALLIAVSGCWLLLGGCNVYLLLGTDRLPVSRFLPHYLSAWAASTLLPGQLGDATLVVWLRDEGVPLSRSAAAYLVDKALSLAWLLLVAAAGVLLVLPESARWIVPLLALAGALAIFVLGRRFRAWVVAKVAPRGVGLQNLIAELGRLRRTPWRIALNLAITIVKWALTTSLYWIAFRAVGEPQALVAVATLPFASSMVGYLPISVGGLGTMEWSAVALFGRLGASAAAVIAVYLLLRGVLVSTVGASLVVSWLRRRVADKR